MQMKWPGGRMMAAEPAARVGGALSLAHALGGAQIEVRQAAVQELGEALAQPRSEWVVAAIAAAAPRLDSAGRWRLLGAVGIFAFHVEPTVRAAATQALARGASGRAAEVAGRLMQMAGRRSPEACARLGTAMGSLVSEGSGEDAGAATAILGAALQSTGAAGAGWALEAAVRGASSANAQARDRALAVVSQAAGHASPEVRRFTVGALTRGVSEGAPWAGAAVSVLAGRLGEQDPALAAGIAETLTAAARNPATRLAALRALREAFGGTAAASRTRAAEALGALVGEGPADEEPASGALVALMGALGERDGTARALAGSALGSALRLGIGHRPWSQGWEYVRVLCRMDGPAAQSAQRLLVDSLAPSGWRHLADLGKVGLAAALAPGAELRSGAAEWLSYVGRSLDRAALVQVCEVAAGDFLNATGARRQCVLALGLLGASAAGQALGPSGVQPLCEMVQQQVERRAALALLGGIGDRGELPSLVVADMRLTPDARLAALEGLRAIGWTGPTIRTLETLVRHPDAGVRSGARATLDAATLVRVAPAADSATLLRPAMHDVPAALLLTPAEPSPGDGISPERRDRH